MGVYKYGAEFLKTVTGTGKLKSIKYLPIIHHYFVDGNGGFHDVAQKIFCYRNSPFMTGAKGKEEKDLYIKRLKEVDGREWRSLMEEYEIALIKYFDSLVDVVKPKKTVTVCVDGIAPCAKIVQQRNRRVGGGQNVSMKYPPLDIPKASTGFSSNFITPGTEFMIMVDKIMQKWCKDVSERHNVKVIYSSHLLRGEGEHKIFELVKKYMTDKERREDIFSIEGVDSDLIPLTMLRKEKFYLVRSPREDFMDIVGMKKYILSYMKKGSSIKIPQNAIIRDFVFIMSFVGNDFLPRMLWVDNVGDAIYDMMEVYSRVITKTITMESGDIHFGTLHIFLKEMLKVEEDTLKERTTKPHFYPHPVLNSERAVNLVKSKEYMSYIKEKYHESFLPQFPLALEILEKSGKKESALKCTINNMCNDMLEGLVWVVKYYMGLSKKESYMYSYYSTPLLSDLFVYMNNLEIEDLKKINERMGKGDVSETFNIPTQLMTVTPLKYNELVPEPFDKAVGSGGRFNYLFPEGFPVKREGLVEAKDFFMQKAILPLPPLNELREYVNDRLVIVGGENKSELLFTPNHT